MSFVQSGIVRLVFETLCLELLFSRRSDNNRLLNNGCSITIITFWKGSTLVRSLSPIICRYQPLHVRRKAVPIHKIVDKFGLINWVDNINWPPRSVSELTFLALQLALHQSKWRTADARNVSYETFYGGQFSLWTELIQPKLFCYTPPPTLLRSYIRNFLFIYKKYRSDWISLNDKTTLVLNAVSLEYLSQTGNFFFYEMVHWGDCNFISYYHGRVN